MSKLLRNTLTFMLAAVILLAGAVTAYAEDGVENPYIETIRGATVMGTSPVIFIDTSTGMPAYCIDYNRGIPDPESLSGEFDPMTIFDPDTYRGLEALLLAGYPFETGGLSDTEAQACTQLAVWCWTGETLGYGLNANNYRATNGRDDIYDYFTGLMEAARNQTPPDIGIDSDDIEMAIDGDFLTGSTIVTVRNLAGYDIDESVLPVGITVSGYTGSDGDVLIITAALDYAGESITLNDIFIGQDTRSALNLFWYDNSNPNQQRMVISYYDESTIAVAASLSLHFAEIPEPENGYIKLTKTAADTELPLAGAVFDVYDAVTDERLGELTTGEDGTATLEFPVGEVYLIEETAPEGYILSTDRLDVTIIGGETAEVTAVNEPVPTPEPEPTPDPEPTDGKIKLIKKDADNGKLLAGAVFGIYRASDDVKVGELETTSKGEALSSLLPAGDYYLKELAAPDSYERSTEKHGVTVRADATVEITITNKKTAELEDDPTDGRIKLIKKDADNGKLLAGAAFGIYRASDDVKVGELETTSKGEALSPLLPAGDYYLKELTAPASYERSAEKHGVTVRADVTVAITITNQKTTEPEDDPTDGRIKLIKKDADNGKLLAGAVFGLYRAADNVKVCELETTSKGEALSPLLPAGEYYLKELTAPKNYERSAEKYGVTVKADKVTEITITNPKKTDAPQDDPAGELLLTKKAAVTGKLLSGAVFGVYRTADSVRIDTITTGSDGTASLNLEPGSYYCVELTAPAGFALDTTKIPFTIKDSAVTRVDVTNVPLEEVSDPDVPTSSMPVITLPKTGEPFPVMDYTFAALCLGLALACAGVLHRRFSEKTQ